MFMNETNDKQSYCYFSPVEVHYN